MEFPEKGLVRLIYASRSELPERQRQDAVKSILIKSITNNRRIDVTGVLLSNAHVFLQVLEGPSANVKGLYEILQQDPRHSHVKLIDLRSGDAREFRDWNMTARALDADVVGVEALTMDRALSLLKR